MSWYMFKQAPAVKYRGIKVQGFDQMHRPRLNLSWGMNDKQSSKPTNKIQNTIIPATNVAKTRIQECQIKNEGLNGIKVLTETSDDEQEELMKLLKNTNIQKKEKQLYDQNYKKRSQSLHRVDYNLKPSQEKIYKNSQFSQRIRYLQNSLLPVCKRDNMGAILDHNLNQQVPLSQSRMSSRSNRKNESSVVLGNGFNVFIPVSEAKKDLTQQLQQMYQYEQRYKKRISNDGFKLG